MDASADPVARFIAAVRPSPVDGLGGTARDVPLPMPLDVPLEMPLDMPLDMVVALVGEAFDRRAGAADVIADLDELAGGIDPSFEGVMHGLFASGRLRGNREDYGDPRNSFLADVLARGVGLPITLSVVAIEVGRRLGVPVSGVGLPGHFMVGEYIGNESATRFADPFNGGRIYPAAEIGDAWHTITASAGRLRPAMLAPVSSRAIVIRILNNLRHTFQQRGDELRLATLAELRGAFVELAAEAPERARWLRRMN